MKIHEVIKIHEGYKEAKQKFLASNPDDQQDIEKYIQLFRDLVNKNRLQGNEKNIDYWGKQGFESFKEMVDFKSQQKSKTQIKRSKVKGESITIHEDDKWLIVVPLDKEASCFHGKNTDWCTAKPNRRNFEDYFYDEKATLIYLIRKEDSNKWAIYTNGADTQFFDKNNDEISMAKFNEETGLNAEKFIKMAKKHEDKIQKIRDGVNDEKEELIYKIYNLKGKNDHQIERKIVDLNDFHLIDLYIEEIGESSDYSKEFQLKAIKESFDLLKYIKNPDKDVQMLAVKYDSSSIKLIDNPHPDVKKYVEENR